MNKAIIESIEWHKDCLFKLLGDDDLYKEEGNIHSINANLNEIIEKAKKRVWVKVTAKRKGHYREQTVGEKEGDKSTSKVLDTVGMGDFVDFGPYGKLYILKDVGDKFWVTDEKSERNNSQASGWYVDKYKAESIIEGNVDEGGDDQRDLEDVDPFADY